MLIPLLLIVGIFAKTQWSELHTYDFESYQREFAKTYAQAEASVRRAIFNRNLQTIRFHNQDRTQTYKLGVNQFTDRTTEEMQSYLMVRPKSDTPSKRSTRPIPKTTSNTDLPDRIDWRNYSIVTPVKNQGQCGSCWAFAAAETLESHWAIYTKNLVVLSEQQILDCTPNPNHCGGTGGCGGATVELAFKQIMKMGLTAEDSYPYISSNGTDSVCDESQIWLPSAVMRSFENVAPNDYEQVVLWLYGRGPLAVSVDASKWFAYESGIFNGCNQTNPDLNHAVQLIGMEKMFDTGEEFWIVRNSWGESWGESGYIRLQKSADVTCGIDLSPSDGDACDNGPLTEHVCGTCGILFDAVYPVI